MHATINAYTYSEMTAATVVTCASGRLSRTLSSYMRRDGMAGMRIVGGRHILP